MKEIYYNIMNFKTEIKPIGYLQSWYVFELSTKLIYLIKLYLYLYFVKI